MNIEVEGAEKSLDLANTNDRMRLAFMMSNDK